MTKIKRGWQDKIYASYARKIEEGRTPKILLVNPRVYDELRKELVDLDLSPSAISTYIGLQIIQTENVPDFRVVDDRHWYEEG